MQPTAEQLEIIERQLGRKPRGIAAIAYATESGLPVVLRMRPVIEDRPFPTLFWLCSRDLYQLIAEIETAGWVKQIEQELADDSDMRTRYLAQQQAYVDLRRRLMEPWEWQRIEALGFGDLYSRYGIGGIAQWDKVRCLHMQYAHHLVGDNLVGERMDREFGLDRQLARLKL